MGQKCRERGDDDADGKRGPGSPHRKPVARGPHTEHDSDHHQQHADDRGPWRVVGGGHIDPMAAMARPRAKSVNAFAGFITVVFMPAV